MPKGVEVRGNTLRVYFHYENERCREPLDLKVTPENITYAERLVQQVEHEIRAGTFDYGRYFPNSTRLRENRLGHYLTLWLDIKRQRVADSTYRGYDGIVERYIRPKFGDRQADQVDRVDVETWISSMENLASKTLKEIIAVMRQVYDLYRTRYPAVVDPTRGVNIKLPDDEDPDPFNREEIEAIITTLPRDGRIQERNLAQFMIWSGPRVSEAIALAWEDVNLDEGIVHFRRAKVRGLYKATKTKRSTRVHELVEPALQALREQYDRTAKLEPIKIEVKQRDNRTMKMERIRPVFLNTNTGDPHYDDFRFRDRFFRYHLERAEVRYRGPGQCRHTYISQMLTAGMPIEWISKQTGTSPEMIRRRYGKWIDDDAGDMVALAETRLGLR